MKLFRYMGITAIALALLLSCSNDNVLVEMNIIDTSSASKEAYENTKSLITINSSGALEVSDVDALVSGFSTALDTNAFVKDLNSSDSSERSTAAKTNIGTVKEYLNDVINNSTYSIPDSLKTTLTNIYNILSDITDDETLTKGDVIQIAILEHFGSVLKSEYVLQLLQSGSLADVLNNEIFKGLIDYVGAIVKASGKLSGKISSYASDLALNLIENLS